MSTSLLSRILVACVLLTLALCPVVAADARNVHETDGLAVGGGVAFTHGGVGASAGYYFQWPRERLSLRPYASAGWLFFTGFNAGYAGGVVGTFGREHRLVVDLHGGTFATRTLALYGVRLDEAPVYGVGLGVGWEWLTASGFFLRASVGPAYTFLPPIYQASEGWSVTVNPVEIGVKLW